MIKTDAGIRRFLKFQELLMQPDAPQSLMDRYETCVWCVARSESPKTWHEWVLS